jgi:hypothetical protein
MMIEPQVKPFPRIGTSAAAKMLICVLAAAGFWLSVLTLYPGYMTNDATFVYGFMKEWRFGDWQSPLMSMLWALIDPIAPGPGSMFLLTAALYWLGFAVVGLAAARRSKAIGIATPLLGLVPPAFMMLAMIWRDMLFGTAWLLAAAAAYLAADADRRVRWLVAVLALALVGFGILLRPTAIIAAPLFALYLIWPTAYDWKRAAIVFIPGIVLGYALIHLVYYVILDVRHENPLHSLFVFDLGGITYFTGKNQFPVSWNAEQTALLTTTCYDPEYWDNYWTIPPCDFVMQRLEAPGDVIFGSPRLSRAWFRAVTQHPLAYLRHRATFFWRFLAGSNLTLELLRLDEPRNAALSQNSYFRRLVAIHDALKPTILFRTGFWLLVAVVIVPLSWPCRETIDGAFALGVAGSAVFYVLTFFLVGVAADFRYGYWCVLADLVSVVGLTAAMLERRQRFLIDSEAAHMLRKPGSGLATRETSPRAG